MGWVSTLEDAVDRLSNALHMLQSESAAGVDFISEKRKVDVVTILARGESVLSEARTYLEIATDPSIDLARTLEQARNAKQAAEARISSYERSCTSLMRELNEQRQRANTLEKNLAEVTRERNRLDRTIEEMLKSNPKAGYDA